MSNLKFGDGRSPNLASRMLELQRLDLPGATFSFLAGRKAMYRVELSPTAASRIYLCELHVKPGRQHPEMIVVDPDLRKLAGGKAIPHIYPHNGAGVKLCLWLPRNHEWNPSLRLSETYIPWTLRWLWYFEHWLLAGTWEGGGEHPNSARRRYGVRSSLRGAFRANDIDRSRTNNK